MSETMQAGRPLDARVHEAVFGHSIIGWVEDMGDGCIGFQSETAPAYLEECRCDAVRASRDKIVRHLVQAGDWTEETAAQYRVEMESEWKYGHHSHCMCVVPRYSTDIAATELLIEHIRQNGMQVTIHSNKRQTQCLIIRGILVVGEAMAPTLQHAVCLAALKTVGAA